MSPYSKHCITEPPLRWVHTCFVYTYLKIMYLWSTRESYSQQKHSTSNKIMCSKQTLSSFYLRIPRVFKCQITYLNVFQNFCMNQQTSGGWTQPTAIPYSGKLSREKTFANFEVMWLITSCCFFFSKFGGVASFGVTSEQSAEVFSTKIHQFAKVSRYMVPILCMDLCSKACNVVVFYCLQKL